ncbi:hypothetical protein FHR24_001036 [Wenyingzhuangia heitensis]|uniref:Outer membrane protein beta-barrel domain-containing protein n=1 Tax=Wenyingzhuangia heitensis TaxID=1487859 RepID=A0ABX0UC08_9FLAO|nr:outer membrane insertion C- signal [Wenyingzhuangia heitensis]NIJ44597.1 hypothetical protein [Wenyingzhuangia heitensis]
MKKITAILLFIIATTASAQEIGIRLGSFGDNSVAIDGIVNFEDHTRLHGDITFGEGIGANLLYDFKIDDIKLANLNFQYYFGTGLSTFVGDPFILGVNGEAGIEYLFKKAPITLGLDWRPQVNIITKTSLEILQFGFNIRYRINEL